MVGGIDSSLSADSSKGLKRQRNGTARLADVLPSFFQNWSKGMDGLYKGTCFCGHVLTPSIATTDAWSHLNTAHRISHAGAISFKNMSDQEQARTRHQGGQVRSHNVAKMFENADRAKTASTRADLGNKIYSGKESFLNALILQVLETNSSLASVGYQWTRSMVEALNPAAAPDLVGRTTLTKYLDTRWKEIKGGLVKLIPKCHGLSMSIDHWTPDSAEGEAHLGVVLSLVIGDGITEVAAALQPCGHKADEISSAVISVLDDWQVDWALVRAIASDNAPTVVKAIVQLREEFERRGFPPPVPVHCVAHTVQLAARFIIDHPAFSTSVDDLNTYVKWWRAYGKYIKHVDGVQTESSLLPDEAGKAVNQPKVPSKPPATSTTRWNSTYSQLAWMLDVRHRPYFRLAERNLESIWRGPKNDRNKIDDAYRLPSVDWDGPLISTLTDLLEIIEPLAEATVISQSGSVVVTPCLWQFMVSWIGQWNLLPTDPEKPPPQPRTTDNTMRRRTTEEHFDAVSCSGRSITRNRRWSGDDIVLDKEAGIGGLLLEAQSECEAVVSVVTTADKDIPLPQAAAHLEKWRHVVAGSVGLLFKHVGDFLRLAEDQVATAVYCHPGLFKEVMGSPLLPPKWKDLVEQRIMHVRATLEMEIKEASKGEVMPNAAALLQVYEAANPRSMSMDQVLPYWNVRILAFKTAGSFSHGEVDILQTKALGALSIVAASAGAERFFSACGLVDSPRRSRLASRTLELLSLLKFNISLFY